MKITSVSYTRLQTLSGYNNERVGATADVEEGETREEAMGQLKAWVMGQLDQRELLHDARDDVDQLRYQKQSLESEVEGLLEKFEWVKALLEKHGVSVDELDNIPF